MYLQGSEKPYKDPLRELILMTEDGSTKMDETYATNLANEASVLTHIKEIHLESKTITKPTTVVTQPPQSTQPTATASKDVNNLSTLFQEKTDIVDPVKEREFLMRISAIEESDTDGVANVERPILGKVSLMRRAKSAVSRSMNERKINDKHPLFSVAWDRASSAGKPLPHTIDISVDDDERADSDIPTTEEVKRHMEMFHLRHGQPPASAKLSESRKSKHSKSRSSKTKSNR